MNWIKASKQKIFAYQKGRCCHCGIAKHISALNFLDILETKLVCHKCDVAISGKNPSGSDRKKS